MSLALWSRTDLILSGPGDLLALKDLKASLTLSKVKYGSSLGSRTPSAWNSPMVLAIGGTLLGKCLSIRTLTLSSSLLHHVPSGLFKRGMSWESLFFLNKECILLEITLSLSISEQYLFQLSDLALARAFLYCFFSSTNLSLSCP